MSSATERNFFAGPVDWVSARISRTGKRLRLAIAWVVAFLVAALLLYPLNWVTHYDSMRLIIENQQRATRMTVAKMVEQDLAAGRPVNCDALKNIWTSHPGIFALTFHPPIACPDFSVKNGRYDTTRELIETRAKVGKGALEAVDFYASSDNRPAYRDAFVRAFTLSVADLHRDGWKKYDASRKILRSVMFWVPLIVIWMLVFAILELWFRAARRVAQSRELEVAVARREARQMRAVLRGLSNFAADAAHVARNTAQIEALDPRGVLRHARHELANAYLRPRAALTVGQEPDAEGVSVDGELQRAWEEAGRTFVRVVDDVIHQVAGIEPATVEEVVGFLTAETEIRSKSGFAVTLALGGDTSGASNALRIGPPLPWLRMIVRTVLDNSIRQLSVAQREARRSGATIPREQLFCRISLDVVPSAGGVTMQLVVWDSAGGFPADLLSKVYVEPIPSSKEANRMGEGSHGVGVWVRLFDGAIRASNEVLGERLGARTEMTWSASEAPTSLSSSIEDGPS